jgi:hypothetical protein
MWRRGDENVASGRTTAQHGDEGTARRGCGVGEGVAARRRRRGGATARARHGVGDWRQRATAHGGEVAAHGGEAAAGGGARRRGGGAAVRARWRRREHGRTEERRRGESTGVAAARLRDETGKPRTVAAL